MGGNKILQTNLDSHLELFPKLENPRKRIAGTAGVEREKQTNLLSLFPVSVEEVNTEFQGTDSQKTGIWS